MTTISRNWFGLVLLVCALVISSIDSAIASRHWQVWSDTTRQYFLSSPDYEQGMTFDGKNNIWVIYHYDTTIRAGVGMFDGSQWTHFGPSKGLIGGQIHRMIRDNNGDIWVSGDSGISKYSNGVWQTYSVHDEHSSIRKYGALAADSSGNIWVASATKGFYLKGLSGQIPPGLPADTLISEIFRFDGQQWTLFRLQPQVPFTPGSWSGITALAAGVNGRMWAVGNQVYTGDLKPAEGLWRLDDNTWTHFDLDDGNGTAQKGTLMVARSVRTDKKGGIWVSFGATNDNNNLGVVYPAAVNYFDGNAWAPSALTGPRFSDVWLAPNGSKYFLILPLYKHLPNEGLVIADADNNIIDSIASDDIPNFWFFSMDFAADGTPWLSTTSDGDQVIVESFSGSSGVASHGVNETLATAFPNPFVSSTTLSYSLPTSGFVNITVVDPAGHIVKQLKDGQWQGAGDYDLTVSSLSSGSYFVRITLYSSDSEIVTTTLPIVALH
jgi:hypothetical protein